MKRVSELLQRLDETWVAVQNKATKKIEALRTALERWEQYTEQMEDLMGWLRHSEKVVRSSSGELTRKDLEELLSKCRVCILFVLPQSV